MIGRKTLKQILITLLSGVLFLTACGQTSSGTAPTTLVSVTETKPVPTAISSLLPSKTPRDRTHEPTSTPRPPTPLPTIPTFTPTFDVSTIVTVTPATKAECPEVNPDLTPNLNAFFSNEGPELLTDQPVLDFLSSGGDPQKLLSAFRQQYSWLASNAAVHQDITGDGVAELILTDGYIVYVFGCRDRQYQTLLSDTDDLAWMQEIQFNIIEDMNLNGVPELITVEYGGHTYTSIKASLFEWIGQEFLPLIQGEAYNDHQYFTFADTSVPGQVTVYDTDGDGTFELVLESDLPMPLPSLYSYLIPWRNEINIYAWNGTHYTLNRVEYTSPEFRFQAIQDADRETLHENYAKALLLYQDAIFNNKLKAFSSDILVNEIAKVIAFDGNQSEPTSVPPDSTEYPRLAAYAYYRIMLLHIVQEQESDAGTVYKTLQQKFSNDPYGSRYVEMANVFWEAYQSTHKMYGGCEAAIQYAVEHPEILVPLGSDYHGSQSYTYVPADVCPFR